VPDDTEKNEPATESETKHEAAEGEAKPTAAVPADAKSAEPEKAAEAKAEPKDEAAEDEDEGEDEAADEDAFRPEAIAKRIEKIGGETDIERQAREEEAKLAARRKAERKKGKKGLEAAASKKLAKIGDRPVKRAATAVPAEADPLLERTAKLSEWMRDNSRIVGYGVAALVLGAAGFGGWTWWQQKREADASVILAEAVADERGQIGDPSKVKDDPDRPKDPRPMFLTVEARRDAALAKYKDVEARFAGSGAAMLARLGEASLLLDKHDADGAVAAFRDVKASPLAQADAEVRGRALEGLGFAYELKASLAPQDKDKSLDQAMKAFKELEQTDVRGFKELGTYHQARVLEARGDRPAAMEMLKTLQVKLRELKAKGDDVFPYLDTAVDDRLAALDPSTIQRRPRGGKGGMGGMGGGMGGLEDLIGPDGQLKVSPEELQRILQQQGMGGGGAPPAPPPGNPK
jgi:hypothetical protein